MEILKLNAISPLVGDILTADNYTISDTASAPVAILVRSANMHEYALPESVIAVARAGAGVNNIPLDKMAECGVCVFNTPGANANAVKELVIGALIIASRKIMRGINWVQSLGGEDVAKAVEKGKKAFVGQEILGKTLGIVGLGAIGRLVSDAALALGMNVVGYDPYLSPALSAKLDSRVKTVSDLGALYAVSDYITLHVPSTPQTKGCINKDSISQMKDGVVIINCARGDLFVDDDVIEAVKSGKIDRVVTDLPNNKLIGVDGIITIPHLGASTPEAEDNCAVMAAKELKDYIEQGIVVNSVNFPCLNPGAKPAGKVRITALTKTDALPEALKAVNGESKSATRGDYAYIVADCDEDCSSALEKVKGVIKVRVIK